MATFSVICKWSGDHYSSNKSEDPDSLFVDVVIFINANKIKSSMTGNIDTAFHMYQNIHATVAQPYLASSPWCHPDLEVHCVLLALFVDG